MTGLVAVQWYQIQWRFQTELNGDCAFALSTRRSTDDGRPKLSFLAT